MKNHFDTTNLNYISSICLGVIFLCLNLYKNNYKLLITFLIVSILFFILNRGKNIKIQIIDTIFISVIITLVIYNFSNLYSKKISEGFEDADEVDKTEKFKPSDNVKSTKNDDD